MIQIGLSILQCVLLLVVLHHLRKISVLPTYMDAGEPESFDTLRLLLCDSAGVIRHEVSFHGLRPPSNYRYGGRDYRYGMTKEQGVYEYFEIGAHV